MDYREWLHRAEAFVRGLDYLPGQWGICVDVKPPLSEAGAVRIDKQLQFGLPPPLRDFYTSACASCECTYNWTPDESHRPLVGQVFGAQISVYGGARFCPGEQLPLHQGTVRDCARDIETQEPRPGWEMWEQCTPFLAVGNGDYLALCAADETGRSPVLYLSHDVEEGADSVLEVSASFDQFLADWEAVCYIGPEIWLLGQFFAEFNGPLQVNQSKAKVWREVITSVNKGPTQ